MIGRFRDGHRTSVQLALSCPGHQHCVVEIANQVNQFLFCIHFGLEGLKVVVSSLIEVAKIGPNTHSVPNLLNVRPSFRVVRTARTRHPS